MADAAGDTTSNSNNKNDDTDVIEEEETTTTTTTTSKKTSEWRKTRSTKVRHAEGGTKSCSKQINRKQINQPSGGIMAECYNLLHFMAQVD